MPGNGSTVPLTGFVKWFNKDKGYGFIRTPGGVEIFVHANQLKRSGILSGLSEGQQVRFSVDRGTKGTYAVDISILNDASSQRSA